MIDSILKEAQELADEAGPELLIRVLQDIRQRGSLNGCRRCDVYLTPYVEAQVRLHRARKRYNEGFHLPGGYAYERIWEEMHDAWIERDAARRLYRSTPCHCLEPTKHPEGYPGYTASP